MTTHTLTTNPADYFTPQVWGVVKAALEAGKTVELQLVTPITHMKMMVDDAVKMADEAYKSANEVNPHGDPGGGQDVPDQSLPGPADNSGPDSPVEKMTNALAGARFVLSGRLLGSAVDFELQHSGDQRLDDVGSARILLDLPHHPRGDREGLDELGAAGVDDLAVEQVQFGEPHDDSSSGEDAAATAPVSRTVEDAAGQGGETVQEQAGDSPACSCCTKAVQP